MEPIDEQWVREVFAQIDRGAAQDRPPGWRETVRAGVAAGRDRALAQYFRMDPALTRRRVNQSVIEAGVLLVAARAARGRRGGRLLRLVAANRVAGLAVASLVLPGVLEEGRRRVASLDAAARETLGV